MLSKPLDYFLKGKGLVLEEEQSEAAEESLSLSAGKRAGRWRLLQPRLYQRCEHCMRRCTHLLHPLRVFSAQTCLHCLFVLFAIFDKYDIIFARYDK